MHFFYYVVISIHLNNFWINNKTTLNISVVVDGKAGTPVVKALCSCVRGFSKQAL